MQQLMDEVDTQSQSAQANQRKNRACSIASTVTGSESDYESRSFIGSDLESVLLSASYSDDAPRASVLSTS